MYVLSNGGDHGSFPATTPTIVRTYADQPVSSARRGHRPTGTGRSGSTVGRHPSLGTVIRTRRLELGLTQEQLAELIGDGVIQADVSRLELDRIGLPRRPRLKAIAAALGLPIGELLMCSTWASTVPETSETGALVSLVRQHAGSNGSRGATGAGHPEEGEGGGSQATILKQSLDHLSAALLLTQRLRRQTDARDGYDRRSMDLRKLEDILQRLGANLVCLHDGAQSRIRDGHNGNWGPPHGPSR